MSQDQLGSPMPRRTRWLIGLAGGGLGLLWVLSNVVQLSALGGPAGEHAQAGVYPSHSGFTSYEGLGVAAASSDGREIAAGASVKRGGAFDGAVILWDAQSGRRLWRTVLHARGTIRSVQHLLWSPDGEQVLTTDSDGVMTVLRARDGQVLHAIEGHSYSTCVFAFTPQGLLMTVRDESARNTSLQLRAWPSLQVRWARPLPCVDTVEGSVDHSGRWLAFAPAVSTEWGVSVVDLTRQGAVPVHLQRAQGTNTLFATAFRPNSTTLVVGYQDGTIIAWDTGQKRPLWQEKPHGDLVHALAWNAHGSLLASSAFGTCGLLKSECVVVTSVAQVPPHASVAWFSRFKSADSVQWLRSGARRTCHGA